jgi:antirestriction protein ArdC
MVTHRFNTQTERHDVYTRVTNQVIAALESGRRTWHQPWDSGGDGRVMLPLNYNGQKYHGINVLQLWGQSIDKGYKSPYWMTFERARKHGAHVRKDEHNTTVFFFEKKIITEHTENGEEERRSISIPKHYGVFNAEQIAGLPERFYAPPDLKRPEPERIEAAEQFFGSTGADIRSAGDRAFYSPKGDYIQMPDMKRFWNSEAFYGTLAHEFIHWTKRENRCNRETARSWGDEKYAFEEIVAEMGSAFLCADLDIKPKTPKDDDKAGYIQSWLKVLKDNKHAIFAAAAKAQAAADFLHKLQQPSGPAVNLAAAQKPVPALPGPTPV